MVLALLSKTDARIELFHLVRAGDDGVILDMEVAEEIETLQPELLYSVSVRSVCLACLDSVSVRSVCLACLSRLDSGAAVLTRWTCRAGLGHALRLHALRARRARGPVCLRGPARAPLPREPRGRGPARDAGGYAECCINECPVCALVS